MRSLLRSGLVGPSVSVGVDRRVCIVWIGVMPAPTTTTERRKVVGSDAECHKQ